MFNLIRILFVVSTYLIGAIPFGLITVMLMGAGDIRNMGSGNIGATNVLRTTGKLGGAITLLFDALKGFIPVLIAKLMLGMDIWTLVIALTAVLGHNFPVYLKFKGGKGVATSFGVLFALWPIAGFVTFGIWIATVLIWKYSSLGALISFALLPIVVLLGEKSIPYVLFSILISSMIYIRHIDNIKRLIAGEEKRTASKSNSKIKTFILIIFILFSCNAYAEIKAPAPVQADSLPLLVREGYLNLEQGQIEQAYKAGVSAKEQSPDYAPAYFLAARALRKMSKFAPAFSEYIDGLNVSFKDFWTMFNLIGRAYLTLVITLTLTSFTILLAWMIRILPLFHHTFREITSKFIDIYLRPIFSGIIIIFPAIFGIGWFVMFWIIAMWIYLNKKEKVIAVFILIFLLSLPILLNYNSILISGHQNLTLQGLIAADRGVGDPDLLTRLKQQYNIDPDNTYIPLSIAALLYNEGKFNESIEYYNKLLVSDQKGVKTIALNNLGNLFFKTKDYDKAIEYYKAASIEDREDREANDSAIPPFNLSQAFREKLLFQESDEAYKNARSINLKDAEKFSAIMVRTSGDVITYPIKKGELWHVAFLPNDDSKILTEHLLHAIFRISGDRFPFLAFSIMIILTVLSYIKPKTPMAYRCPVCKRIVCGLCTGSRIFGGTCRECRRKDDKENQVHKGLDRRFSFILPGVWHIYKGKISYGIVLNLIFFSGISVFIFGSLSDTWFVAYQIPCKFYYTGCFLLTVSYLMLLINFKYIRMRFNI